MIVRKIFLSILILNVLAIKAQNKAATTTKPATKVDMCELLKKENEALKKSLSINEPITQQSFGDIEFKIVKIKGDIKSQMVTLDVVMTNNIQNREVKITKDFLKVVTIEGDVFRLGSAVVGGASWATNVYLNTAVPIKSTFTFGPMLPSNEYLKLFNFSFVILHPQDYYQSKDSAIEFKDLKIDWK